MPQGEGPPSLEAPLESLDLADTETQRRRRLAIGDPARADRLQQSGTMQLLPAQRESLHGGMTLSRSSYPMTFSRSTSKRARRTLTLQVRGASLGPLAMVILVLSPRLTESRRASFRAVTQGLGEIRFVVPGGPPPDVAECGAIVVDGPQPAQPLEFLGAIRAAVERGAALLAVGCAPAGRDGFWADLLGAIAGPEPPPGEYYARVTEAHSHISARVTREFAVVDGFVPLIPLADGKVIVDVSVALRDLAAVVETPRGAGRVVACGLGNTDAALRTPELAQLLARALRPDLHCCGRNIGVGIVGYGPLGAMGYHHGLGVMRTEGLELVAVVDPNVERRKAAETDFPGVRTYASVSDLVGDDDVEVAFVATPPAHHVALTLTLLRAGKHVACEKPLCLTVAEADQIIATAAASHRVLTVHQNRRWDPDFVAVRRAVGAGL